MGTRICFNPIAIHGLIRQALNFLSVKKKRHGFGHMAPIGPIVMAYSVILCVNMMVNSG